MNTNFCLEVFMRNLSLIKHVCQDFLFTWRHLGDVFRCIQVERRNIIIHQFEVRVVCSDWTVKLWTQFSETLEFRIKKTNILQLTSLKLLLRCFIELVINQMFSYVIGGVICYELASMINWCVWYSSRARWEKTFEVFLVPNTITNTPVVIQI